MLPMQVTASANDLKQRIFQEFRLPQNDLLVVFKNRLVEENEILAKMDMF